MLPVSRHSYLFRRFATKTKSNHPTYRFEFLGSGRWDHLETLPNFMNRTDSGMALGQKQLASWFGRCVHSTKGQAINIHLPTSMLLPTSQMYAISRVLGSHPSAR